MLPVIMQNSIFSRALSLPTRLPMTVFWCLLMRLTSPPEFSVCPFIILSVIRVQQTHTPLWLWAKFMLCSNILTNVCGGEES
jgi:hypothetical protein